MKNGLMGGQQKANIQQHTRLHKRCSDFCSRTAHTLKSMVPDRKLLRKILRLMHRRYGRLENSTRFFPIIDVSYH